ncbi:hypothetical protein [Candidatus Litorirhabdus singularis]|uniref:hypothetical protein n=1 Tax=Candidatus Litorirhabdus singularis TaxID=2518993 RepID=UPI00242D09CE|nr:hypothetical protein [Candidatus Litorirhabdus singularis]
MQDMIGKLLTWGPVFFGLLIFSQMWSAALGISLPLTMAIGLVWGFIAMKRGRWL